MYWLFFKKVILDYVRCRFFKKKNYLFALVEVSLSHHIKTTQIFLNAMSKFKLLIFIGVEVIKVKRMSFIISK